MIEHEGDAGAFFDQRDSQGQLPGQEAKIEAEGVIGQLLDVLDEERRLGSLVRHDVQDPPHAFDVGEGFQLFELIAKPLPLGTTRRHDAGDEGMLAGQRLDMPGLVELGGFIHVTFDEDRFFNVQSFGGGQVILRQEAAVQRRNGFAPRIGKPVQVPKMLVRIDNAETPVLRGNAHESLLGFRLVNEILPLGGVAIFDSLQVLAIEDKLPFVFEDFVTGAVKSHFLVLGMLFPGRS